MGMFQSWGTCKNQCYGVFRVVVGVLFFLHGYMKLFGAQPMPLWGLLWWAGVIEFLVGLGIALGFFTRLAALAGALEMLVAYVKAHLPQGFNPLVNQGEVAVLYFVAFLVIFQWGAVTWSLEQFVSKKEKF